MRTEQIPYSDEYEAQMRDQLTDKPPYKDHLTPLRHPADDQEIVPGCFRTQPIATE